MVSKESEYLIHLAEKQLERLNKSLYFYQQNAHIEDDLLNLSVDSLSREASNLSLTPVYSIIDRQRQATKAKEVSRCSGDMSPKKQTQRIRHNKYGSHSQCGNDSHIRDWRNMAEFAQKTLGPNKQTQKCNFNSTSVTMNHKKEKLSTFWDYNGHKRIIKISKSAGDIEKSERETTKCCGRRDSYSKNEIRKYIRDKQRLYREKQCASNIKNQLYDENMRTSLIKLNNEPYDDSKVVEVEHYDHFYDDVYNTGPAYDSASNTRRCSKNQPIYDELRKEGLFDYKVPKKKEHPYIQTSFRSKNGLNSTADSGFETGEWLQTVPVSEPIKTIKDTRCSKISNVQPNRENPIKKDQTFKYPPKSKKDFHDKIRKQFKDKISAYDASSENEMVNDNAFTPMELTPSHSPYSFEENEQSPKSNKINSTLNKKETHSQFNSNISKTQILDCKLSASLPNCNSDFSPETSFKKLHKKNIESSQTCLVQELKEALLEAQRHLNPNLSEPPDTLSERIAKAVENFIKTTERLSESSDVFNEDMLPRNNHTSEGEHSIVVKPKSESLAKHNESRKDHLSTEFEATEIEHEKFKQINKIGKIDSSSVVNHEIIEVAEERNSISINSDQSEVLDDVMKENITANLETRKRNLESRREKANELIKLTQEFKKESKRVILLEKKACQFSKQFLKDSKFDKKTYDSKLHDLKNIGIIKFPRHAIPPDGKDSGRSDIMDSVKIQLSPRMGSLGLVEDIKKVDDCPSENSIHNPSELSDVDEPTVSISEISTTITDQSELEARLVALRTEMFKKHQLVVTLKLRQKEMKRDNIKQKEVTLQKQIEMYDAYISKLQSNIEGLEKRSDDAIDDDSHTLTGSTSTINELEPNFNEGSKVLIPVSIEVSPNEEKDKSIDDIYLKCCDEYYEIKEDAFDKVVDNNRIIAGEDIDLDSLSQIKHIVEISNDNNDQVNITVHPKKGSEGSDIDIESIDDNDAANDHPLNTNDFEEMVKRNSCCDDLLKDLDLEYLYSNEINLDVKDDQFVLDQLVKKNPLIKSPTSVMTSQIQIEDLPEVLIINMRSVEQDDKEKKKIENNVNKIIKDGQLSSVTLTIHDAPLNHVAGTILPVECESTILRGVNVYHPNIMTTIINKADLDKADDGKLKFQISSDCDDDDTSSISDIKSLKVIEEDLRHDYDGKDDCKLVADSVESSQDISMEALPIPSPVSLHNVHVPSSQSNIRRHIDNEVINDSLNSARVEQLVEYLLNVILKSEFEEVKQQRATVDIEKKRLLSAVEVLDFQSTSFMEPNVTTLPELHEENIQSSDILRSENLWEFKSMVIDKPKELLETSLLPNDPPLYEEFAEKDIEKLSVIDMEQLEEKLKWLIPFEQDPLETYIQSALRHFFDDRQNNQGVLGKSLLIAPEMLPDDIPRVTEAEVNEALFDSSKNHSYIDKRIIFQLVKEVFLEIYSFERYLPPTPWMHPSFMIKKNNYTMWKGDKPPESYDLVNTIVRERISHIFNQQNIRLNNVTMKVKDNCSYSKITKWCIERQKDHVDKLLINDLCKEENEWVYYDEAEEEVKVQISGDIFQFLITDTIYWLKSILSQN